MITVTKDTAAALSNRPQLYPLCVDLDGALVRGDLLVESLFILLKQNILYLFLLPYWLTKGRAAFKAEVASRVMFDAAKLLYNQQFLTYLKQEHTQGQRLILATGANDLQAHRVAEYLGIFDCVLASSASSNCSGEEKLKEILVALASDKSQEVKFVYAGNARSDLPVWRRAKKVILVDPEPGVKTLVEGELEIDQLFESRSEQAWLRDYLRAIRLHQWFKNLLL